MGEQLSSTKRRSFRSGMSFRSSSWNSQGIKSEVNSSSWINTHFSETALGETNPDHKWQIRNVLEAGTPFSANKYQVSASPWSFTCSGTTDVTIDPLNPVWFYPAKREDSGNGVYWDGQWPSDINSNSGIVTPLTGSAQNLAIDKLYGQLQAIQSSVQAGEDLGEIKQTYSALKKPMASLTSLINRLTYVHNNILADYNDSKRLAKALADTALEWKFGWKPLASTIAGAIVGLQGRDYISDYFPFSASGSAKTANRGSSTFGIGTLTADVEKRWGFEVTVKYKGMWGLQAGVESRSVQDVLSLRPRDIIPTVWNLIPYSFLVDYVSNIGTIMNAFSVPWDGVRWCSKTVKIVSYYDQHVVGCRQFAFPARLNPSISQGQIKMTQEKFVRSVVSNLPIPSLELDLSLSMGQKQNVLALLASRLPIIGAKTKSALDRMPNLQRDFAYEARRRGMKVPYPSFHS